MNTRDLLSIRDLSPSEMQFLLVLGRQIKSRPAAYSDALRGKTLAILFEKPSLRTRVSFDVGIQQLGGFSVYLSPAEINLGKRESIHDVAKTLERMAQGIVLRTFAHERVEEMALHADIPVINGLSDFSHPCQAMADFLTIWEVKGRLQNLKLAFVGDGNNVAHSLMFGGAQLGLDIRIATPQGYEPDPYAVAWAEQRASENHGTVTITPDPEEAVTGADIIYTDVWTSMGQEAEAEKRREIFRPYQVNSKLFALANYEALFMHCLPAHRGEEVTSDVLDSAHSVVFQQAENRLHVQKAILIELMKSVPIEAMRPAHDIELVKA
ncbi:MAG TPA: ornithine carbamoyltransferase [Candidatus Limnocylindrales bacterium]|nr:ornithine carbamoyltransferase [Candidatus Limnocylindrales bacterium]